MPSKAGCGRPVRYEHEYKRRGSRRGNAPGLPDEIFFAVIQKKVVNHDFAGYHIASNAGTGSIEAYFLDEEDPHTNPMGSKGIGAVYHATGLRVRDLPITLDKLLFVRTGHG